MSELEYGLTPLEKSGLQIRRLEAENQKLRLLVAESLRIIALTLRTNEMSTEDAMRVVGQAKAMLREVSDE